MKSLAALALSPFALSLVGCADAAPLAGTHAIDLAPFATDGARLQGVSSDPVGSDLHVLIEGRGLLQISREGQLVTERAVGQKGLEDRPYRDVAVVGDGRFLFIADNEGYLWDEVTETQKVHFCVEPGFNECLDENGNFADDDFDGLCNWEDDKPTEPLPEPLQPVGTEIQQRNDALALTGALILAAPRFYEDGQQIEASLRTYNVASGDPTGSADLSGLGLDIAGLDADGDTLVGVSGSKLSRFSLDGEEVASAELDINDGVGLVIDGDTALVLDRDSQQVVSFDIKDVR